MSRAGITWGAVGAMMIAAACSRGGGASDAGRNPSGGGSTTGGTPVACGSDGDCAAWGGTNLPGAPLCVSAGTACVLCVTCAYAGTPQSLCATRNNGPCDGSSSSGTSGSGGGSTSGAGATSGTGSSGSTGTSGSGSSTSGGGSTGGGSSGSTGGSSGSTSGGSGAVTVATLAGSGQPGFADGPAATAKFSGIEGIASDSQGLVYVADSNNNRIRKVDTQGNVTTYAGDGAYGTKNGAAVAAEFENPTGLALDAQGNLYVGEQDANLVRKIDSTGQVTTLAGSGAAGFADGAAAGATFNAPTFLAIAPGGKLFVVDFGNHAVRTVDLATGAVTTLAGNGTAAVQNGSGGQTGTAEFSDPAGIAVDPGSGTAYVTEGLGNLVRAIDAAGNVTTLAGSGASGLVEGSGSAVEFDLPTALAVDATGTIYVADANNAAIRTSTAAGVTALLAGGSAAGFADGPAASAEIQTAMHGLALDGHGHLFVGDGGNFRIRIISL